MKPTPAQTGGGVPMSRAPQSGLIRPASRKICETKSGMRGKLKRLSKKECQRRERARAEEEAKTRSDSEKRQDRIKELWTLITSGKLTPKDDESDDAARSLKSEVEAVF